MFVYFFWVIEKTTSCNLLKFCYFVEYEFKIVILEWTLKRVLEKKK